MSPSRYEGWLLAGRYRLKSQLGKGGMGRVWQGHDELLDRPVAVKEVTLEHQPQSQREVLLGRTMTEARLAARLSHPNIATVYDVVVADERPWIVLQLVSAPTLADVLAERGSLPPVAVARIGLQVLEALEVAHAAGIVHRDVKPANILLDTNGHDPAHHAGHHAVLTDFGLATSLEQPVGLTQAGIVVGTPAYIAPERARGGAPTPQSDLWSLGVTLYTAVEGRCPFEQSTALATISAVLTDDPAPFRRAGALAPLITGLLRKDPAHRTATADAHRHLRRIVTQSGGAAVPETGDIVCAPVSTTAPTGSRPAPAAPARRPAAGRGRSPYVRHASVVTALILAVLVAGFWQGSSPRPPTAAGRPVTHSPVAPPTDGLAPAPLRVLQAEQVTTRPQAGTPPEPASEPASRSASESESASGREPASGSGSEPRSESRAGAAAPPGKARKARVGKGQTPPGHSAAHPGKGHAKGRK
ncbi:serine/threonine-protein kinase [Nonomuraea candida]|uniref:serine/threonine-protein kinase n=1 Tax=Nonomuraea candida TaxID=359159 RepID=UPI0006947F73|nr:serine/threonine-protein kinase [Nonomuraea candida]